MWLSGKIVNMTNPTALAPRFSSALTVVVLLPVLWWCLTLTAGALGLWWESIGGVVVTWNLAGAVGLILLVPATIFAFGSVSNLHHPATFRRGRWYATVGLMLTAFDCLLGASTPVLNAIDPPAPRDPYSWSPELTFGEEWVAATPYAVFLVPIILTLGSLWRVVPTVEPRVDR